MPEMKTPSSRNATFAWKPISSNLRPLFVEEPVHQFVVGDEESILPSRSKSATAPPIPFRDMRANPTPRTHREMYRRRY